jgi:hypothetical protein
MRVATGTVVAGQVVLDDSEFIDGTHVVVSRDREDDVCLSAEMSLDAPPPRLNA